MSVDEPKFESVSEEDYEQKFDELSRRQRKGGEEWKDFMENLEGWADGEGAFDMECQGEFPEWPTKDIRRIYEELREHEHDDEE